MNSIKKRRNQMGLTQKELAEKIGTDIRWIQKLESGEIKVENITFINAIKLIKALTDEDDIDGDWKIAKEFYCLVKGLIN